MSIAARIAAVEIEDREVRVVVVKTGGKLPVVLEAHSAEAQYDDPEERYDALVGAARQVIAAVKGPVSAWVYCASSQFGVARNLRIPFKGKGKVKAVVPGELEPMLAVPIDELVVDQHIVREFEGQTDVLAVAQRRGILEESIDILREAGASIEGVTNDVAALTTLWRSMRRTVSGIEGVLHVRPKGATFVLANSKTLVWYCQIPMTADQIHTDPDRLVQSVQNGLRSFFATWAGEETMTALTITGNVDETVREQISASLDVPATVHDLLVDVKGVEILAADSGGGEDSDSQWHELGEEAESFAPLIGAAVGASGKGYVFNFLAPDMGSGIDSKSNMSHLIFSASLVAAALICYGAYCYADYSSNMRRVNLVRAEIQRIYETNFPGVQPPIEGDDRTGSQLLEALTSMALAGTGGPLAGIPNDWLQKPPFLQLLAELSTHLPEGKVDVRSIKVTSGRGGRVLVSGESSDFESFQNAFSALKAESKFTWADVGKYGTSGSGDRATFEIEAEY